MDMYIYLILYLGYMGGPPGFGHPGMAPPFVPRQQHPPQHPMKSGTIVSDRWMYRVLY